MSSFVEDLLNLRLLQEGNLELIKEPFSIIETLDFVVDMFQVKAKAYGVAVSYEVDSQL